MKPVITGFTREMETILRSVGRYTRFVRSTKLMLGVLAGILICAILFYPLIRKEAGVRVAFTSIDRKAPVTPTEMLNARFHGLDKDNQPYNVTSKKATQMDEDTVLLDHPIGDLTTKTGAWFSVNSNDGVFKMKENTLDLKGSIEMFNDEGYEFRTELMHVTVNDKTAVTHDEVRGHGPLGTIRAYGGATVHGGTQTIDFEGPVFVTVYPSHDEPGKKAEEKAQ